MTLYSNYPDQALVSIDTYAPGLLQDGESFLVGAEIGDGWLHPGASNYTFVVELLSEQGKGLGVYKPQIGEAPLRDFPAGSLYLRECATYELSKALNWRLVPPTVVREGEAGIGSLQLFIPNQNNSHYFTFFEEHKEELLQLAVFDLLINNADRKGGHCLLGIDGKIWAIDNGLTFHLEHKLRTVIWDFAGEKIPDNLVSDMRNLHIQLIEDTEKMKISSYLLPMEITSLIERLDAYIEKPELPSPQTRRDLPWPLV